MATEDNINSNGNNLKEAPQTHEEIMDCFAFTAVSLQEIFDELLEHVGPGGGYLCDAGRTLAAKIGFIADEYLDLSGRPVLKGDAAAWLNVRIGSHE